MPRFRLPKRHTGCFGYGNAVIPDDGQDNSIRKGEKAGHYQSKNKSKGLTVQTSLTQPSKMREDINAGTVKLLPPPRQSRGDLPFGLAMFFPGRESALRFQRKSGRLADRCYFLMLCNHSEEAGFNTNSK